MTMPYLALSKGPALVLVKSQDQQGHALVCGVGAASRHLPILPQHRDRDGFDPIKIFESGREDLGDGGAAQTLDFGHGHVTPSSWRQTCDG